jgi:pimeloyl-ACP methyl ester carboxylesterase
LALAARQLGVGRNADPTRRWLTVAVLSHLVISIVHGWAHTEANVPLSRTANLFVFIVILAGPVAFGDRDWILPKSSRHRSGLPAHARWIDKRGWGHVPMWVDPAGVSQLILEGCGVCAYVKERR